VTHLALASRSDFDSILLLVLFSSVCAWKVTALVCQDEVDLICAFVCLSQPSDSSNANDCGLSPIVLRSDVYEFFSVLSRLRCGRLQLS
jgi:hypothetical protein